MKREIIGERNGVALQTFNPTSPQSSSQEYLQMQKLDFLQMNDLKTVERDRDQAEISEQMNSISGMSPNLASVLVREQAQKQNLAAERFLAELDRSQRKNNQNRDTELEFLAKSALSSPHVSDPYQDLKQDLKDSELRGSLCAGIGAIGGTGGNLMSSQTKSLEKLKNWNQMTTAGRHSMEEQTISRYLVNYDQTNDSIPRYNLQQDKYNQQQFSNQQSPLIQNFEKQQSFQQFGQGSNIVVHGESNSRDYTNYSNQKIIPEDINTIKLRKNFKDQKEDEPSGIFTNNEYLMPSRNPLSSYYKQGPSTVDIKPQSKLNVIEEQKIQMQNHSNVLQAAKNLRNPIQGMQHSQKQLPRPNFDNLYLKNEQDKINRHHANTLNNSRGATPISSIQKDDKDLIHIQKLHDGYKAQTRLSFYDSNLAQSQEYTIRPQSRFNYVDTTYTLSKGDFQDVDTISRKQQEITKANTNNESEQIAKVNSFYNKNEIEQNSLNQRMIELKKEITGKNINNVPPEIQNTDHQQKHIQNISTFSKQSGLYEETKDNSNKRDEPSKDISYPIDTPGIQSEPAKSMQINRSVQIIDINTNDIKSERIKEHKKYDDPKSNKSAKSTRSASLRANSNQRAEPYTASYFQSLGNLYGNIPKKRSGSVKRVGKRMNLQKDLNILGDFDVDRFYMKLMKKERQEFKKILKSQEMVIRFDVEKKLKKQLLEAEEKTKKSQELEKNFIFAKNNNHRLRNEHEKMISKLQSLQNKAKTAQEREHEMRETLEEMWQRYEANKQVLIDATKLEVQQEKEKEILEHKAQVQDLQSQIEDQNKIYQEKEDLRLQVEILENQKTDLVKENARLKAQMEKREQENKKLKKEIEQTHAIKVKQLQENYENVLKKFEDLASKSNNINVMTRQYSIDEDTLKNFNNLHSAEHSDHPCLNESLPLGRNPYGLSSHAGTQKTINIHDQVSGYQSVGTIKKQKKDKNEWKLKCQILAEKYFGIIKDIKNQLKKLKKQSADQIEQVRIETTKEIMKKFENQVDIIYLKRENEILRSKFHQTTPGFQSQEVLNHKNQSIKNYNQDLLPSHQFAQSQIATLGVSDKETTNRIQKESSKTRVGEGFSLQLGTAKSSSQVSFRSQFGQNYQKFNQLNESHLKVKKQLNSKDASSLKLSDNNFILPLQKLPDTQKLDSKSYDHSSITNRAQREPPTILLRSDYTNSNSPVKNLKNKSASDPDNSYLQNSNNRSSDMSPNPLLRNCNPLFQNKIPKNESQQLLEREAQFQEIYKNGDIYSRTQDQRDQLQNKKTSTIDVKSNNSHVSLRQPVHHVQSRALSGDATTSEHLQNFIQNQRVKSGNGSNHSIHSGSASLNAYYQKHKYQIYKDQQTLSQQNNLGIYSGTKEVSKMSTLQQILKSPEASDLSNQMNRQSLNFNSTQQVEVGAGGMFSMNKHSTQDSKDYSLTDMNSRLIPTGNQLFQAELPKRLRQNNIPILVSFQRQATGSIDGTQNEPFSFVKELSRGTPELNGTYNSSINANFGGNKTSQKSTAKAPTSRKEIQKNIHHQQSSKSFLSKKEGSKLSKQASDVSSQKSKQKSNKSFTSAKQAKPIIRHESTPKNIIASRSKNRSCSSNNSKIIASADHKVSPSPYSFLQSQKRRPSSSRSQKESHKRQKSIKGINDLKGVISPRKKKRQDLSQDRVSPSAGIDDKTYDYFSRVKQPVMYYNRLVNSESELKQVKEIDQEEQTFEQLNAEIQKSIEALKDITKYAHASASATSSKISKMSSSRGPKEVKGKVKGILKTSSSQVNSKQK